MKRELSFVGYYQINWINKDKEQLLEYSKIKGKVCKLYACEGSGKLVCKVKGIENEYTNTGLFYLTPEIKNNKLIVSEITKEEYDNEPFNMDSVFLVKGYHPNDCNKKQFYFVSDKRVVSNLKVLVDTKFGEQQLIVIDCVEILKDEEKEWLIKLGLSKFKKVLGIVMEYTTTKTETRIDRF